MVRTEVRCTLFKLTGKLQACGATAVETPKGHFDQVIDAVRALRRERAVPGLPGATIAGQYHLLVEVADVGAFETHNGTPGSPEYLPGGLRLIPADEAETLPEYVPMHLRQQGT